MAQESDIAVNDQSRSFITADDSVEVVVPALGRILSRYSAPEKGG